MLESIMQYISGLSPFWVYMTLFLFALIENVFPPSPSDLVVIFGAALITTNSEISFLPVLIITSFGSSTGFIIMYYVGKLFGEKILRTGKIKFISREGIDKTDKWFNKYGYKLIIANRFLPGTRSIISFFSGITELDANRTFIFASISALVWNLIIIYLGIFLGNNIPLIDKYLSTYSNIIIFATILFAAVFFIRYLIRRRKTKKETDVH